MLVSIIGFASGVVSLLVFLTGRPSIQHFLPVTPGKLRDILPTPVVRWKFAVRDDTLFLRHGALEIALLTDLHDYEDYRIFSSGKEGKLMILYRLSRYSPFHQMLIVNWDGSCRKEYYHSSGYVDARWFDRDTFVIYRKAGSGMNLGDGKSEGYISEGNYLMRVNEQNQIVSVVEY